MLFSLPLFWNYLILCAPCDGYSRNASWVLNFIATSVLQSLLFGIVRWDVVYYYIVNNNKCSPRWRLPQIMNLLAITLYRVMLLFKKKDRLQQNYCFEISVQNWPSVHWVCVAYVIIHGMSCMLPLELQNLFWLLEPRDFLKLKWWKLISRLDSGSISLMDWMLNKMILEY